MSGFEYIETGGAPIKAWTRGVSIEDAARRQIENVARLPFIHKHVAVMPDVHWGMGATVGSVIPTVGAIIPAAVGVDIGCGMAAVRTNIMASELPDSLGAMRAEIEAAVPHGRTDHGRRNDTGAWTREPPAGQTGQELNKGESRNSLARAVFIHRLGEIRDRTYENQQHRFSGLNLLVVRRHPAASSGSSARKRCTRH